MADSETIVGDSLVWKAQNWLNKTYGGKTGYVSIDRDGITGWGTINALLRAFQIELGITATSTNFGPTTTSRFKSRFPNGIQEQNEDDSAEDNIYGIIECACWCKGYSTRLAVTDVSTQFKSSLAKAIKNIKNDAGCNDKSSNVTLNIMKALLSMDQFQLTIAYGGTPQVRTIQKAINNKYEKDIGELIPTDGVYGRKLNSAFVVVLQVIEGFSGSGADGVFGNGTKSRLPMLPSGVLANGTVMSEENKKQAILLLKYALCCNGYDSIDVSSGDWDTKTEELIKEFQNDMVLSVNGTADVDTWMSLLLSKGNTARKCEACDTSRTIYPNRLKALKTAGYNIIGRYIVGTGNCADDNSKELRIYVTNKLGFFDEAQEIINKGMKIVPLFQREGKPNISYYTSEQAKADAEYAFNRARMYRIPKESIIYFSVDLDVTDNEIKNIILPYFKILKENLKDYKVGIYGTRNLCTQAIEKKYVETCYVSDMSTGYSGNLGFKMPKKWNLDQFGEQTFSTDGVSWVIDKVAYSGKYAVVDKLDDKRYCYDNVIELNSTDKITGLALKYGGRHLKPKFTATNKAGKAVENEEVLITIKKVGDRVDGFEDLSAMTKIPVDGNEYTFEGEFFNKDNIIIEDGASYYLTYSLLKQPTEEIYLHVILESDEI